MDTKQTQKKNTPPNPRDYSAIVGVDWADRKHALATLAAPFEAGDAAVQLSELEQKTDALIAWTDTLRKRFGGRVAVVVEQRRGALIHFLSGFEFIDIIPVEPAAMKNFRKALYPSGAKSDPVDAALLVEFFLHHPERLRCWRPQSEPVRQCARYCEDRRTLVDERATCMQRLKASLKLYFPLALELFDDLGTRLAGQFLQRWPTLEQLQRARPATLRKFFYLRGSRSDKLIEKRLQAIASARPLTTDPGIVEPLVLRVDCLAKQIATLSELIARYEKRIAKLMHKLDSQRIFRGLPGAGTCLAPRLACLFGEDRSRFESPAEIQMMTAAAPVTQRSGKMRTVTMRWAASTFQRQTVVEFAKSSLKYSKWARAFFDMHMPESPDAPRHTYTVLRKLAFKWLRILFRCWQSGTAYDEEKYIKRLRDTGSPIWRKLQQTQSEAAS
jgi:transposase